MAILSDWELWACANEYVRQHGVEAPLFAAVRADALSERGDVDGARNWQLIAHRIRELLADPRLSSVQ